MEIPHEYLAQAGKALIYYIGLILIMRLSGKRLAGQTTTFDLIILITLGVVLQTSALQSGFANSVIFVCVVFSIHKILAIFCARSTSFRHFVRGTPRSLVKDGVIIEQALQDERISEEDLRAGLRKLGFDNPALVKGAILEETGQISAIRFPKKHVSDRGKDLN